MEQIMGQKNENVNEKEFKNKQAIMINPYKVWEKFYFSVEDGLTNTIRDTVHTQVFANKIDLILNSYLQHLKFQKSVVANLMEDSPFSSKRDVARVAELVVALENKIDGLENELSDKLMEFEQDTDLISNKSVPQTEPIGREELLDLMKPVLMAIQDFGQRLSSLEGLARKLDENMNEISRLVSSETKVRPKNATSPKKPKQKKE